MKSTKEVQDRRSFAWAGLFTLTAMAIVSGFFLLAAKSDKNALNEVLQSWEISDKVDIVEAERKSFADPLETRSGTLRLRPKVQWDDLAAHLKVGAEGLRVMESAGEFSASSGDLGIWLRRRGDLVEVDCTIR